ncbi:MAG: hypothetical protein GIX03_05020 [Candidatus Eremiobacteraeota bacterium]|nr:hypothetical protein [Candidatus Eremiobacteraeota bacterium]MBC5809753.1 hypothetical protein [Candidatus Eremiobacteraeota bacterium]
MATIAQVERQIFEREGFRVRLAPLNEKVKAIPPYEFSAMAPQRWRVSDWKTYRLTRYITVLRGVTVLRGDGSDVGRDMQLGNLRDTYYEADYGPVRAPEGDDDEKVIDLAARKAEPRRSLNRPKNPRR